MLVQKMWVRWETEVVPTDFLFPPIPSGVPHCGNFAGWPPSAENFLLGIQCMQKGKSPVIALPAAVFVLLYLGYAVYQGKNC